MAKKLLVESEHGLSESNVSSSLLEKKSTSERRDELYATFQHEIEDVVKKELLIKETHLREKLQAEHNAFLKKFEKEYSTKVKLLERRIEIADALILSLREAQEKVIRSAVQDMDPVMVQICMEVLYKISGEKLCFEKVVEKALKAVTAMYLSGVRVKLFVSEEVFGLFAEIHKDSPIGECVLLDKSLRPGQIRIDDGASITEAGLIEQLDNVRTALLSELRKARAI